MSCPLSVGASRDLGQAADSFSDNFLSTRDLPSVELLEFNRSLVAAACRTGFSWRSFALLERVPGELRIVFDTGGEEFRPRIRTL